MDQTVIVNYIPDAWYVYKMLFVQLFSVDHCVLNCRDSFVLIISGTITGMTSAFMQSLRGMIIDEIYLIDEMESLISLFHCL